MCLFYVFRWIEYNLPIESAPSLPGKNPGVTADSIAHESSFSSFFFPEKVEVKKKSGNEWKVVL
jgi:hypothetical protein